MNILWITWKDTGHPEAGGAEVVCYEICKRLVAEGHSVTLLTTDYAGAASQRPLDGVQVLRIGSSRYLHPYQALAYYIRRLRNKYDVVVEEVNGGAPYFSVFFGRKSPRYMLYHQLARTNWLHEIPAPFSYVGFHVLVPLASRLASFARVPVITVSESTRRELAKFGFKPERTNIISEGTHIEPVKDLAKIKKYMQPTVLVHGSMRAMKRTIDQIKAFELAKKQMPKLKLKVSGSSSGAYGQKVMSYIAKSPYKKDIEYLGRTTDEQKVELMQRCHVIIVTSVEEGWGLIVTEANSQGTPAVVYDVHGLRDSVRHMETGLVTAENPAALADGIVQLLGNKTLYKTLQKNGWEWSKTITFNQTYQDFKKIVKIS
ncbi:MAG TPA: glycosyltransferase family 4 protein [Candidatus Saccharimonadales bacterium]|nr:glycosyltransferase family 4 protein [Candidatus Saccharimonadales bacterium]